jgi:hypothetical protein
MADKTTQLHKPVDSLAHSETNSTQVPEVVTFESIADKLAQSNKEVAYTVSEKMLNSNDLTAEKLVKANNRVLKVTYTQVAISLVTLTLLIIFGIVFFRYAIVVTTRS